MPRWPHGCLRSLAAFSGLVLSGTSANLISLGAMDFGIVVDSSVIMMENLFRHLGSHGRGTMVERIRAGAREVEPADLVVPDDAKLARRTRRNIDARALYGGGGEEDVLARDEVAQGGREARIFLGHVGLRVRAMRGG